jgi:hypothetical protein
MPPISWKKVLIAILVIVALSRLNQIINFTASIYQAFYDSFEPLRNSPPLAKYIAALMVLFLLYITIFKLLQNRKGRR